MAIAALHALGLWRWFAEAPPPRAPAPASRVSVRLVAPPSPPSPRRAAPPKTDSARPLARRRTPAAAPPTEANVIAVPAAPEPTPVEPAASSTPLPSLLDGEATRAAIRDSARRAGPAAQVDPLAPTRDERLGRAIAQGARGDCLKGEYAGAGMGLLSLPFLAAAALRDRCRP